MKMEDFTLNNPLFPQPEMTFIEDLKKPLHDKKPELFGKRSKESDEIDISGAYLVADFPDPEELLTTAYDDFKVFLKVYEFGGDRFHVTVKFSETSCFEEYTLKVTLKGIEILAADTEGIRRGIIYLEDLIKQSEAPFFKGNDGYEKTRYKKPYNPKLFQSHKPSSL